MKSFKRPLPHTGTVWAVLAACSLVGLAGCQDIPILDRSYVSASVARAEHPTILVFEETEATCDAVKQTILKHLPPGTPLAQAQAALEHEGFTCHPFTQGARGFDLYAIPIYTLNRDGQKRILKERNRELVACLGTRTEDTCWHLKTDHLLIVLIPDEANNLRDVEVGMSSKTQSGADFFQAHPDIREPLGMPISLAQARMESAGFVCQRGEAGGRRTVHCERPAETVLGGRIIRVTLLADDASVICETRVHDKAGWFDAERCMLPHQDDALALAVARSAAFPARIGCRYALETAGVLMICCVLPYGGVR